MESLMLELLSSVHELQTTHKIVSDRIDQLISPDEKQQDSCCNHDTEELQKDISGLQTKVEVMNSKSEEHDQTLQKLYDDAKLLQNRLDCIGTLLLSKQTDDSKLQRITSQSNERLSTSPTQEGSKTYENKVAGLDASDSSIRRAGTNGTKESNGTETQPNFVKQQIPKVQKQKEKLVLDGERYWRSVAQNELERCQTQFARLDGVHSVICLDISESMSEGIAWPQAQTFLTDYLRGLEEMSKLPNLSTEHVALVTFGHETKTQMRYTDRYSEVQTVIENLKLGGPSQMYGGILFALAAAWCSSHRIEILGNHAHVFTKMIIITDGKPTEADLIAGPDIADTSKVDETKAKILQEMERFRTNFIDLFFVPVGSTDVNYFKSLAAFSNGIMLNYKSGKRLARRQYLSAQLIDAFGLITDMLTAGFDNVLSPEDKEDMRSVQERGKLHAFVEKTTGDLYGDKSSKSLPSVGSRVRRGPDWKYKMQDSNGPGTIIGHSDNGVQVWVEWDANEHRNVYNYGKQDYDILIVDEPRELKSGETMAVGCEVKPGRDWSSAEEVMEPGIVIKLEKGEKKAMVRWSNGERGKYSFGYGGPREIEIWSKSKSRNTNTVNATSGGKDVHASSLARNVTAKQNKNKNKSKS